MPTYINLTLSRLDFMTPFYRLLIIPSNLTIYFQVFVFQLMSNLLVTSKYDACRMLYHSVCVSVKPICQRFTEH